MTEYERILSELIDVSRENRDTHSREHRVLDRLMYAKNFCTVKLDIGRAIGKSTYIYENATRDDIVICSHRHLFEKFGSSTLQNPPLVLLHRADYAPSFMRKVYQHKDSLRKEWDIVYIDDYSSFEKSPFSDDIILALAEVQENVPTFVLLG